MNRSVEKSLKNISANHLSGLELKCKSSGKIMKIQSEIYAEIGSFSRLLGICQKHGEGRVFVISQVGLEKFVGNINEFIRSEYVDRLWLEQGVFLDGEIENEILFEINHVNKALFDKEVKLIIGVGGGAICDIAKFVAKKSDLPLCFVPSAPTTDGMLSNFSVTCSGEMIETKAPDYVVCDAKYCSDVPAKIIRAGFGDTVANYLSVFDWMVAKEVFSEDFSEEVAFLAISAADRAIFAAEAYLQNPERGVELMFEAVLLSSGAMSLFEKNTPCCGGEHSVALALSKIEKTPRMHGEGVFLCFCKLLEVYSLFFSSYSTGKYLPPDTSARCDTLISEFGYNEAKAEKMCKPPISEAEYKIMREKYRICRHRYIPNIKKLQGKIPQFKSLFFGIHGEDGESFNINSETFQKALAISPDIMDKNSTLTIMREFGLLENGMI